MFRAANASDSSNDINKEKTLGLKNRLAKFTRIGRSESDDTTNILGDGKTKARKKTKKEPAWVHEHIYDVDEIDSKFEGNLNLSIAINYPQTCISSCSILL